MDPTLLLPKPWISAPNLHPMMVHFPAALLPVAFLFFVLAAWRQKACLFIASKYCVYLATLGGLAAVWTGWNASETIPHGETLHTMMQTHKYAALTVLAGAFISSVWCWNKPIENKPSGFVFAALLILTNLVLIAVGDLGARMVYREGAAVQINTSPSTEEHHEEASHTEHEHEH